jgi:hypothetical protein
MYWSNCTVSRKVRTKYIYCLSDVRKRSTHGVNRFWTDVLRKMPCWRAMLECDKDLRHIWLRREVAGVWSRLQRLGIWSNRQIVIWRWRNYRMFTNSVRTCSNGVSTCYTHTLYNSASHFRTLPQLANPITPQTQTVPRNIHHTGIISNESCKSQ